MDNQKNTTSCLFKVPIFSHLNVEDQEGIRKLIKVRKLAKGETLYNAGQPNQNLYVVHGGQIKISRYNESGNEQVVRILTSGDFTGEQALFTNAYEENFAISLEETTLCVLDGNELKKYMIEYPTISIKIISELSNRLLSTENKLEEFNLSSVEKRLSKSIIDLSNGNNKFKLPISKLDWASMLGMSSETLSRKLREFKEMNIINLEGQRGIIILDKEYLISLN